ncbi:MAG: hypothetical protein KUA43_00970 [Hoeflea sp.]|uniref:hypothetical protein n=1 Tax=Hoeflea sp. TaxID=1940281 RepID=UPI001DED290B|nr:hypothetical protein [Hoeflea sp.]MBU4530407.1 hypothetical protein [Alphaproteobacteria bacterium]MBU4545194.1 hypothetical protein [Alphaproteobacteria bacterium]MBU4549606.1 hypothetical protein [Alphaproteobacteria bacterium]MBV1721997.1 hypothetical protein [Hoeflea sp.]MBV1761347.1 hypothetical protein [Hoeflea sp.]
MRQLAEGFQIDGTRIAWGTTPDDLALMLGRPLEPGPDEAVLPCSLAYGLPVLSARPRSPAANRPILYVAYDLDDVRGLRPDDWVGAISDLLGSPGECDRYDLSGQARLEDMVKLHARWPGSDFDVSLSLFGAPRTTSLGPSVGTLWVSWPEERAAEPYLASWNDRSARLATLSRGLTDFRTFALAWPANPVHGSSDNAPETTEMRDRRHRRLCLYDPDLLATPEEVAERLNETSFAIWINEPERIWCVSTLWETLFFADGTEVSIDWIELHPARGGGYSAIEIGPWRVMSSQGSPEIAQAVRHLDTIPGVRIEPHGGHDC